MKQPATIGDLNAIRGIERRDAADVAESEGRAHRTTWAAEKEVLAYDATLS
jgi:hypothetical protein